MTLIKWAPQEHDRILSTHAFYSYDHGRPSQPNIQEILLNINAILVPVDGSPASLHAVEFAIQVARGHDNIVLHVLSVQAPIISGNAQRFISAEVVAEYYQDEGRRALDPAKAILDKAGVAYQEHIKIGQIAETIYHFTKEHDCGLIAMGTRGLGSVAGLLMGSITTKVLSLVEVPVTLVK